MGGALLALSLAGCAVAPEDEGGKLETSPLVIEPDMNILEQGVMDFETTIHLDNPTTRLDEGVFQLFEFAGRAGGRVTISMRGKACGGPDTFLYLFGPGDDTGDRGQDLIHNDDAFEGNCSLDSKINNFALPVDGEYVILASSYLEEGGGSFELTLTCPAGDCAEPGAMTFATSRIAQADIEGGAFSPEEIFEVGDFLFEINYRMQDGMGNGHAGAPAGNNPRPNFRGTFPPVHQGGFGAPEAQSCLTCHNVGGDDGGGSFDRNIFQIGDGVNVASGLQRNPPHILGMGYREAIARDMTIELKAQLDAAKAAAASSGTAQTATLTSKEISFGSAIANPDGTVDFTGLQGIDTDLVVRPFGWKGRESLVRRFIEGGLRVHFGMQTTVSIAKHCVTPNPGNFGNGADCRDPDTDGVSDEIIEGQLTALAVYGALLETPVTNKPTDPAELARFDEGVELFETIGCNDCHRAVMPLNNTIFTEPSDSGGPGFALDLAQDSHEPRPNIGDDGVMRVVLWSDFKRHDMGPELADSKNFNQIPAAHFVTTPLWGVATTAPYMHDGRAPTITDAIEAHGGEGAASRDAWLALSDDDRAKVLVFLDALGREEEEEAAPGSTDLSGFRLLQTGSTRSFTLPANTRVQSGGFVVVGRSATKAQFEAFYGITLGPNVVYVDSRGAFPLINGSETFALQDAAAARIDGPSAPMRASGVQNFQRKSGPRGPAEQASSWNVVTSSKTTATPGSGQTSEQGGGIYISEFSDMGGFGNFRFEFVEIFVE